MSAGAFVRRLLGPFEGRAADLYRAAFVDLGDVARRLARPGARRILEVGCGDGCLATQLLEVLPDAAYLGIDVAPLPGRLYAGAPSRAEFRSAALEDLPQDERYDMVVIADVLHHVPTGERRALIAAAAAHVGPGGVLAVKEWERRRNLAHLLAYVSDRYVSGDAGVRFMSRDELLDLLDASVTGLTRVQDERTRPWRNNLVVGLRATAARGRQPSA